MFEVDSPTWIAVVVASVYLLQSATQDLPLGRWLSPFSLGWIIAGLMFLHPLALRGSWIAIGAAYLLMGALIVNTLILSAASKVPTRMVSFKSDGLEQVALMFTGFVFAGIAVLVKHCFTGLLQLSKARHQPHEKALSSWSSV